MGLFNFFTSIFSGNKLSDAGTSIDDNQINPASGLPMVGGIGGVDVEGNPYGTDSSNDAFNNSSFDSFTDDSIGLESFYDSGSYELFSDAHSYDNDSFGSGSGFDD